MTGGDSEYPSRREQGLVVLGFVTQQVSHRIRLTSVISDVEHLVLDEVAPRAPLTWVRIVLSLPRNRCLGGFADPRHLLEHLGDAEADLERVIHTAGVVAEAVIQKRALDRELLEIGPMIA